MNMAKNQKSYTPEFKQQIVDLYNAGGTSYPKPEREYGVNQSTLSSWVKQLIPVKVSDTETVTVKELKALQKENQRLKNKKSDRHIRKRTITEIVTFIQKLLTVTDAMGKFTTYTYNELGLVETVTDSMNHVSEYSYNSRRQNTAVRDAANGESEAVYDLLGNVTRLEGPLDGATTYANNDMGRIMSHISR